MYPGAYPRDRPAVVSASGGAELTYGELEDASVQLAHHFRSVGLQRGDHVALLSGNDARMLVVYWAALRSGLYLTAINHHLKPAETAFILSDCGARLLIVSADLVEAAERAMQVTGRVDHLICLDGSAAGYADWDTVLGAQPVTPPTDQPRGSDFLYSSGTTGTPRGILHPLPDRQVDEPGDPYVSTFAPLYGMHEDTVYLCPAPLYHAAPMRFCMVVQTMGGTVVLMDHFEPEAALEAIERYGVTHSQWVPTMFIRMLKLAEEVRLRHDVSSMRCAIHAAAPCPIPVKRAMIEWWGPVINEYYASTEGAGATFIDSEQALARPGSVGRDGALGTVHVCDPSGDELPPGEVGAVYFEREQMPFAYFGDELKTRAAQHPKYDNWSTTGDIGYLDEDRYLYLTDRAAFMIISGGVNIYPQEIENALVVHPEVLDAGVIGLPDEEMGERVHAVVVPAPGSTPGPELAARLREHLRGEIAHFKVPSSIDFTDDLPRTPTGKLIKRDLRARYV